VPRPNRFLSNTTQTNRIKLDGVPIKQATERVSISNVPTRLECESSVGIRRIASFQVRLATSDVDQLM